VNPLELKLQELIRTCKNFVKVSKEMLDEGTISKEYYNSITKKKLDFIKSHESNIIQFPKIGEDFNDVG